MLAMDVDGTLTDGGIYIGNEKELFKKFDAQDGMGLTLLRKIGIIQVIITGRVSDIVKERARELKITEVIQDASAKDEVLTELMQKYNLTKEEVLYIGDDLNDLSAYAVAGVTACPANATDYMKERADILLTKHGGQGAIRELAEMILKSRGIYEETIERVYGSKREKKAKKRVDLVQISSR
jgi:3-deoxy-D-manno-octulosonate 8-phosphate phosphatase (KDO 8-P phosphatase)